MIFARDRMGEKPLYLYEDSQKIVFASELKAMMSSGLVKCDLDPEAVNNYFHYQYVPEPKTPIRGVRKLPAAHVLTVDVDSWELNEQCYWRIEDARPIDGDPALTIRSALEDVSNLVIRADVPVGVALSGGLDSSAIAALAAKRYRGSMHAFSVGYEGNPDGDETDAAKQLADHLKMPFHRIELRDDDMVADFPKLVMWRDDPIADIAGYGYYSVMKAARENGVPVMLQGQGGDELFWGYPWVKDAVRQSKRKQDALLRGGASRLRYIKPRCPERFTPGAVLSWAKSLAGMSPGLNEYHRDINASDEQLVFYDLTPDYRAASDQMGGYYSERFASQLSEMMPSKMFTQPFPWPRLDIHMTKLIMQSYLMENGIAQGDRLGMASSVELRLPLLDHKYVETVIGLRKASQDHHLPPKYHLKESLKEVLPNWVMNRPKRGFSPPVSKWYEAIFSTYGHKLHDGYLVNAGILSPEGARSMMEGPFHSRSAEHLSFKALVLELWCRGICGGSVYEVQ